MMPMFLQQSASNWITRSQFLVIGLLTTIVLAGCNPSQNPTPDPSEPSPMAQSPAAPSPVAQPPASPATPEAIAKISAIQNQPVWVKLLEQTQENAAEVGMALRINETIRTEGAALAEVEMLSGAGFRIGGNAKITLQPDQTLNLGAGEMITWVEPGKQVPAKIVTPAGVAGIRGTTVFVKIPEDPNEEVLFFSWEGQVAITLPDQLEEIILNTGEEVTIRPGDRDVAAIRRRVRRLRRRQFLQRWRDSRLSQNFKRPLPTKAQIEAEIENRPADTEPN